MPENKRWRAAVPINIGDAAFEVGDLLPKDFKPPKLWIERGSVTSGKKPTTKGASSG
jgi:hypothetical protein